MLWSLALAAVCGVLAVLFSAHETAWRVVGTMFATAVAAGLLMWTSAMSERERTQAAGLLGMGTVVVEWMLAELLIWDANAWFGWGWWFEERVGLTMFFGAATTIWTMLALACRKRQGFALASVSGLVLAGLVAVLWLAGLWWPVEGQYGSFAKSAEMILGSAGAIAMMGALGCLLVVRFSMRRWWVWIALLCGAIALAMLLTAIWMDINQSNGTVECLITVTAIGVFWNLLRQVQLLYEQQWVVWATMAATAVTGLLLDVVIVLDKQHADVDMLGRLASSAGILTGCGMLAIVVLTRLNRHDIRPTEMPPVETMTVVCPVCQKKQTLKIGEARCAGCGLGFEIKVKEPRCPQCNYLLFMLQSDRCPECGATVR